MQSFPFTGYILLIKEKSPDTCNSLSEDGHFGPCHWNFVIYAELSTGQKENNFLASPTPVKGTYLLMDYNQRV